jgi:hypothetical protein
MRARIQPLAFLVLVSAFLAACSGIGLAPPQSFEERLAYAYGAHTAVLDAATTSVGAGDLSAQDGTAVLELADESRIILDGARLAWRAGDLDTAEARLVLATGLLQQLQAYLRSKGGQR